MSLTRSRQSQFLNRSYMNMISRYLLAYMFIRSLMVIGVFPKNYALVLIDIQFSQWKLNILGSSIFNKKLLFSHCKIIYPLKRSFNFLIHKFDLNTNWLSNNYIMCTWFLVVNDHKLRTSLALISYNWFINP